MTSQKEIEALAKKLWSENEEFATELANVIFGIRDGDYDEPELEYPIFKKSVCQDIIYKFTNIPKEFKMTNSKLIEEIRADRINEHKQEMYEELQHERNMCEDRDYAIESVANEIDEANEILRKASEKLFEYGYDISPIELLSEI